MAFDVLDLRLFLAVVEHGSITAGAESVHLSLPSASSRIRAMEGTAGSPLLRRHRRGVVATRSGELLLDHAREIVGRHDRMRLELADLAGGGPATVTVLADTAAALLLPDVLVAFLVEHPDIDVDLVQRQSHRTVAALAEGRAELGVFADTVDAGRLQTVALCTDALVVAAAPDHPVAALPDLSFADAAAHPIVDYAEGSALPELLSGHARPLGGRLRHRARFPDTASVCRAVAAGVGIAVLPARCVPADLVAVPLLDDWADRTLILAARAWADLSRPAADLADRIRSSL